MTKRNRLTRDRIVEAAMQMLDAHGQSGFSMRKLAGALGVDPMALYHHFSNRAALMHAVMEGLIGSCPLPPPSEDWRADIRALCQALRQLAHDHPGTFRLYEVYDDWLLAELHLQEAFHATLYSAGFSPRTVVRAVRLLIAYTESFAVDEVSGWLASYSEADRTAFDDHLVSGAFPVTQKVAAHIATVDADADFAFGLDVLIRGLEAEARDARRSAQ